MDTDPIPELPADIKQQMTRYKAPPGLERRIRHMLAQDARRPGWFEGVRARFTMWAPLGASFAAGVMATVLASALLLGAGSDDQLEQQVVSAHVRSLMANHLFDVQSTDQHTVKPWFTGKLDFAPPVADLAQQGFPLVGGRLDYLDDRAVAALVYQRRGHRINVFVMPASDSNSGGWSLAQHHGYQIAQWQSGGMHFWAVSDIGRDEMKQFTQALKAAD